MRILVIDPTETRRNEEREPNGFLSFFFSTDWEDSNFYDLIALPVDLFLNSRVSLPDDIPVFSFGPADLLADALAGGASDYLKDPWSLDELEARALRYWRIRFRLGGKIYSYSKGSLEAGEKSLRLPESQWKALELLLHRLGKAVPRDAFLRVLNRQRDSWNTRLLDMAVSRLRKNLSKVSGDGKAGAFLVAVRNYGYLLDGKPCG